MQLGAGCHLQECHRDKVREKDKDKYGDKDKMSSKGRDKIRHLSILVGNYFGFLKSISKTTNSTRRQGSSNHYDTETGPLSRFS